MTQNKVIAFLVAHEVCGAADIDVTDDGTTTLTCKTCGAGMVITPEDDPANFDFFVQMADTVEERFGLTPAELAIVSAEEGDFDAIARVYDAHPKLKQFMEQLFEIAESKQRRH